jgi:hypothetical protein
VASKKNGCVMKIENPQEFRATMIENHRQSYTLFKDTIEEIERIISTPRNIQPAYSAYNEALNLLFIQAYKSFSSVYVLWVRGNGEDAATILRRLMEIAFQIIYLEKAEENEKEERGAKYLAYFWGKMREFQKTGVLSQNDRDYWEKMFQKHKQFLNIDSKGKVLDWWGGGGIKALAQKVDLIDTYNEDYKFLSQMVHCPSVGIIVDISKGVFNIRSNKYDRRMEGILVYACRYMIAIAEKWNKTFNLLNRDWLSELTKRSLEFYKQGELH